MKRGISCLALLLVVLVGVTSASAQTHVQTGYSTDASVTAESVTITTTTGNAVIANLLLYFTDGAITQTAGDTFGAAKFFSVTSGIIIYQYAMCNVAGGSTTYTFTFPSNAVALFVTEVSGLVTSGCYDVSSTGTAQIGQTTFPTGTATPNQADFCLAILTLDGGGNNTGLTTTNSYVVPTNGSHIAPGSGLLASAVASLNTAAGTSTTFGVNSASDGKSAVGCYQKATASGRQLLLGVGP